MDCLSADVAGAVSALGRRSCTLVGHDWGGAVAWVVAGRYPGLVDRLVVVSAPHWLLYKRNLTIQQMARSSYFLMFQARHLHAHWTGVDCHVAVAVTCFHLPVPYLSGWGVTCTSNTRGIDVAGGGLGVGSDSKHQAERGWCQTS